MICVLSHQSHSTSSYLSIYSQGTSNIQFSSIRPCPHVSPPSVDALFDRVLRGGLPDDAMPPKDSRFLELAMLAKTNADLCFLSHP
jgi:hypothetical protein